RASGCRRCAGSRCAALRAACSRGSSPLAGSEARAPGGEDLRERAELHLVARQPGARDLVEVDRAAVERAQEVVEQTLAGGRVIEDLTDQRRLRRFLDEVAQALGRLAEAFAKESEAGRVAHWQLRRVQVPALI